mmetsp:Transcript_28469/g.94512  ORF Transcript_28469/g.94512 Transcript_28469/m.94512 type:complete len:214 (-) Transcript_28469:319-960(-)
MPLMPSSQPWMTSPRPNRNRMLPLSKRWPLVKKPSYLTCTFLPEVATLPLPAFNTSYCRPELVTLRDTGCFCFASLAFFASPFASLTLLSSVALPFAAAEAAAAAGGAALLGSATFGLATAGAGDFTSAGFATAGAFATAFATGVTTGAFLGSAFGCASTFATFAGLSSTFAGVDADDVFVATAAAGVAAAAASALRLRFLFAPGSRSAETKS